ncbi:crotonase/enoyl-CoA hydratase family protein [Nocardia cyriacigeorgica]|uniref:crotonase/enoyl-CoA hydratase family protein n=2 Tax=Nocardia cyriacigeorgica TaxID=135487 RepID=UPI001894E829|nr:crotonase/enoyl-CoA hydratase family protein [Nocardia cyriacigeorgica]MBF6434827.1 crotonase/enoyl-CoA hydratase family protein [Nocardia cyriacigeorgica]MBF6455089.1 crotonase/enoyl-CoA hydratase family protein [Nocardia cyriacigeorgica]MBF6552984.1 crotonase/enoyl-CoA hydratase family protein [Nocardia cyriacigeorgica]
MGRVPRVLRQARNQARAVRQLTDAVLGNPRILRDLAAGALGRAGSPEPTPIDVDHVPPAGLAEFDKRAHAATHLDAPAETVAAYLTDPARFPEWLTMHAAFRGETPTGAYAGLEFGQQVKFMGLPADIAWTVVSAEPTAIALRGRGPMGLTLGFWLTVHSDGAGSLACFDAGLSGQPVEGPLGASLVRTLSEALRESLDRVPDRVAAAGPLATRRTAKPVVHTASGRTLAPNTPVLVGAGQFVSHTPDTAADPATLAAKALRIAAADTGASAGESLLTRADAVFSVASASWQYRDMGALVAAAVGAREVDTVQSSRYGGDGGQLLINEAAQAISDGTYEMVLVTGAEAGATLAAAQRSGAEIDWPEQGPETQPTRTAGIDREANNAAEIAAGLGAPIYMYALMESANRHRLGREPKQHLRAIGELWSRMSAIGARNPNAWLPQEFTGDELTTPSSDNRMVSAPYTKLLCANLQVDMAAGLVLCSVAAAEAAGIAQDKWIFLHAGASAHDEWFVSERAELAASPAIRTIGAAALEHAGIGIDQIGPVDLYSCFPVAVQIAARELGLPDDDPARPLSVTGGLTFGGGPGNNYGTHAVATMVEQLRAHPDTFGLSTSLGWYVTKHAIGVYSATPPRQAYAHLRPIVDHPPARPVRQGYEGQAVVEAYTLPYDRDGRPEAAILSLLTPEGARVLLRSKESGLLDLLADTDALGLPVTVRGEQITIDGDRPIELPAPPPPPVLVERRGPIMILTLNRPAVRNAVNHAMAVALERACDAFDADPALRVAVLTGADGYFSSGMDLKAMAGGEAPLTEGRGPLGLTGKPPRKPLIAAVEGPALAGGCELALAADLIVAARDAQFGIPEPKRGLIAAAGGVLRLRERLPRNIAMELALTGDPMPATTLAEFGLINAITEPGDALDAALDLAERIAVNAPLSVLGSKQIIEEAGDWDRGEAFDRQSDIASTALFSEDAAEGVRAFTEKRDPIWKGR